MKSFDARTRADHAYMVASDECWWLSEYICGRGRGRAPASQLIISLKSLPMRLAFDSRRARDRRQAVRTIAALVRGSVARDWAEAATWIPIPPSDGSGDSGDDHRLLPVLRMAFRGYDVDIRNVLSLRESTGPEHLRVRRSSADALERRLQLNWHALAARPLRERLVLIDDVVTTGKHYRSCERRLHSVLPQARINGLFVARRVLSGRACRAP